MDVLQLHAVARIRREKKPASYTLLDERAFSRRRARIQDVYGLSIALALALALVLALSRTLSHFLSLFGHVAPRVRV